MNKNIEKLVATAEAVPDARRQWGHLLHKLSDILVIAFCAIICGAQSYSDLEIFGNAKKTWLSTFLDMPNGIPNADTFERIFEMLDATVLANRMRWLLRTDDVAGRIIAFDGKTMRGSRRDDGRGFHVLNAFLTDTQTVLGEIMCEEKSNEITAIPELLDTINVEKSIITIDAMGTQTKVAEKIMGQGADYCLALKRNQASLYDDVKLYFNSETVRNMVASCDKGHGRMELREYRLETEIDWLFGRERWAGLRAIACVKSTVERKGKTTEETRYFLTSLTDVNEFARAARAHWGIENHLHWHLDVTFGEDSARVRNKNAAGVWNILRKLALEYLKVQAVKGISLKGLRKQAGWDSSFLELVLFCEK